VLSRQHFSVARGSNYNGLVRGFPPRFQDCYTRSNKLVISCLSCPYRRNIIEFVCLGRGIADNASGCVCVCNYTIYSISGQCRPTINAVFVDLYACAL